MTQFGARKYSGSESKSMRSNENNVKSSQIDCDWLLGLVIASTYLLHFLHPSSPVFLIPWNKVGLLIHVGGMWPLK